MKYIKLILLLSAIILICNCSEDQYDSKHPETKTTKAPVWCSSHNNDKLTSRQRGHINGPGWSPCDSENLTISVPECLSGHSIWGEAITNSVQNYNNVQGTSLNIEIVENDADIAFSCFSAPGNCGAGGASQTMLVNEGRSDILQINEDWAPSNCEHCTRDLDICSATHIIMHEMFHALGFFHNHDYQSASVHIPGTPDNDDPNSIINSADNANICNLPCEFSAFDIIALLSQYPEVALEGPEELCVGESGNYCVTAIGGEPDYHVDWKTISGGTERGEKCRDYTFSEPGTYTITAEACEEECCWDVSTTVIVTGTEDLEITGPDQICVFEYVDFCIPAITTGTVVWNSLNGEPLNGGTCKTYFFTVPGIYTIEAEACQDGCCVNLSHEIEVTDCEFLNCACDCGEGNWYIISCEEDCPNNKTEQCEKHYLR